MSDEESITEQVITHYKAGVKASLLAEYRCNTAGCLLIHVWQAPGGIEFFAPERRLSDGYDYARAIEAKFDSNYQRAGRLEFGVFVKIQVLCTHTSDLAFSFELWRDIADRTPGKPVRILLPRDT